MEAALWDGEVQSCALADCAFDPHSALVAADDSLNCGQADSRSGELTVAVQALEGAEQTVYIGHVEAGAVVAHEVDGAIFGLVCSEFYPRLRLLPGVLPGIAKRIFDHNPHQIHVRID